MSGRMGLLMQSLLSVYHFQTDSVLPAGDQRRGAAGQARVHMCPLRIARRAWGGPFVLQAFFFREVRSVQAPFSSTVTTRIWS